MPKPFSNCMNKESIDTELSRELVKLNLTYSRSNCLVLCEQKQNIDELGCYDMRYPRIFNAKPCKEKHSYEQLKDVIFYSSKCSNLCPHQCETVNFDVTVSYSDFPSYLMYKRILMTDMDKLAALLKTRKITHEVFSRSLAAVDIHFNEVKVTEMEESPAMTVVELISNIGGTIGLFISFSILGVVEFIELVIEAAIIMVKSRAANKNKTNDPISV